MIKDILEQLAPLDAQIAALKGSGSDMEAITAHASELAELAVEEDEILRSCGPLTAEDRVFLARHPERPHIDETISALFTDFFEQRGDRQCKEDAAILGVNCTEDELVMEDDGTIAKHQVLRISLTFDHRLLDGAVAAKFEMTVRDLLEHPMDILL